jgi:flagellar basal-body rod protein FlgF
VVTAEETVMDNPSSVALSGELARMRQMEVLANNISNLSTVGFKGEQVVFAEVLASTAGGAPISYVQDQGTVRDWGQGPLTKTDNPLDVALQGAGFLEVETAAGVRYTRDGRLKLDPTGQLVSLDGHAVLGEGDRPIVVPAGTAGVTIGEDGTITAQAGTIGRLQVVNFPQLQALVAEDGGRYATDEPPEPVTDTKVVQGMVEESNVQPVIELTRLMASARSVEAAKTFQDGEADRRKGAIERLAKVV